MYTGIIECTGELGSLEKRQGGAIIFVKTPKIFKVKERVHLGDSVATNGVCVTATAINDNGFSADISEETMSLTCYKYYKIGSKLNLELPCTPNTHLGGHIVQGHVDGVGKILSIEKLGDALNIWIEAPHEIAPFIAHKGSIAIDGASLTVNSVSDNKFRLTIIPHTQDVLSIDVWKVGAFVNIEVDVLARYLQRLFQTGAISKKTTSTLTKDILLKNGFI